MAPAERSGPDDEKVTINLGPVDLGRVDLLVREGVYSSRTDFIRGAIRKQLDEHSKLVDDVVTRKSYNVGLVVYSKGELEKLREKGERVRLRTVGVCIFGPGVTKELVSEVFEDISVLGSLRGPKEVVEWVKQHRGEDR